MIRLHGVSISYIAASINRFPAQDLCVYRIIVLCKAAHSLCLQYLIIGISRFDLKDLVAQGLFLSLKKSRRAHLIVTVAIEKWQF